MIRAEALTARAAPVRLAPVTIALGPGVHAIVGAREDGVALLLATFAGRIRPRSGRLTVLDRAPAEVRASIAYVPVDLVLPDALRVDEVFDLAASIRGEPGAFASHRLAALGLAPLASRKVRSLSFAEARAVAMAEAVTSTARVVVIEEPFVSLDPRAAPLLAERLRARAQSGACVLVGTASPRDAAELADGQLILDRGVLVRAAAASDVRASSDPRRAMLRFGVSDTTAVLAELAAEPPIDRIVTDRGTLVVSGGEVVDLAGAVARAVEKSGVELHWLRADSPSLPELRAALAAEAAAAYQAARGRPPPAEASPQPAAPAPSRPSPSPSSPSSPSPPRSPSPPPDGCPPP